MKKNGRRLLSVVLAAMMLLTLMPSGIRAQEPDSGIQTVDFSSAADADKFQFYHSSAGGFTVQNGMLTPTGETGEFKAVYQSDGEPVRSVSVELHPQGADGAIYGGLYINASNAENGQDRINALYIGVESHFIGWEDAKNRVDLIVGSFPAWQEYSRKISETGNGNNLFTGGVKQPLTLKAEMQGNTVKVTLSLTSNPAKNITTTYTASAGVDLTKGAVGVRSHRNNASFDNFTVEFVNQPPSQPPQEGNAETAVVPFDSAKDEAQFSMYHSSTGGFAVSNGKLTPKGVAGEFKAIYRKPAGSTITKVSVELHPGADGTIVGGLYINASKPGHPVDRINALYVGIESHFSGWTDAPNRIDLMVGSFPTWQELQRTISETGMGNNLFSGGVKQPLKLTVEIQSNQLLITLSLLSNPAKQVTTTYSIASGTDLRLGDVGIRSPFNNATYDNFTVEYIPDPSQTPTEPSEPETEPTEPETEPTEPPVPVEPTDLVNFEQTESSDRFDFYHSSEGGLAVVDGKLVPTGAEGQFKAIYKDTNASFSHVAVDIYPGEKGINGGLYLDVTDVGHGVDQVNGLGIIVQSDFSGWEDAPNRTDIVLATFPQWTELHRVISETGAGNNLFAGGKKEPIHVSADVSGNQLTVTVSLLSDPSKMISTTYVYEAGTDIALGNVGIRSQFNDASFDNFAVVYDRVEADKEPDQPPPPEADPSDVVDFENTESSDKFDFYNSSNGGFILKDGKLVPAGDPGEFKAIYRDGGNTIQGVSVDIYPGESGLINSGIYIGASTVESGADRIKSLAIMIESNHEGWDDAINRIDLVVGRFPIWKELHRYISETGSGNALFTGAKEPLRLRVDIDGNQVRITLSLISNPAKYVTTVYEYTGATHLSAHNVGIRSANNDVSFDDFSVYTTPGGGSPDPTVTQGGNTGAGAGSGTPGTGDASQPDLMLLVMFISLAGLVLMLHKKRSMS